MFCHPAIPGGTTIIVHVAIATGARVTPLRHKHGKAAIHCRLGIRPFTVCLMLPRCINTCVEMESICHISIVYRIARRFIRILVIAAVAHDNQVIGMLANGVNHRNCILLDGAPRLRSGLVENLEDDVVVLAPFLRHVAEELLGIVDIIRCLVAMVVDNHVDIVVDGCLHHRIHQALVITFLGKVVTGTPVLVNTHRRTDNLNVLLLHEPAHDIGCPERRTDITRNAPEEAHTLYRDFVTAGNALAGTVNLALAAGILACLKLAILAYRPHAPERCSRQKSGHQNRSLFHTHILVIHLNGPLNLYFSEQKST